MLGPSAAPLCAAAAAAACWALGIARTARAQHSPPSVLHGSMRAVAWALLPSARPALRSLSLAARARPALTAHTGIPSGSAAGMGQALSLLPLPGRGQRREVAAAAKGGRASPDRPADEDPDLWMICGLGNPGPRYEDTRHNVGFMAVDALARQEGIACDRLQETAAVGRGRFCGKKVLLVKPMTFMNVSGEAVGKLARFYRIPVERVVVVYDDLDLPNAQVRLRAKGGHGGHNGMKSISAHLQGTKDFPRIRVGIGRPPGSMPVVSWVLQDFNKAEREEIDIALQEVIDILRAVFTVGMDRAVSGTRVDREGKPIKPPHSNGKQGGGGKQGSGQQQKAGQPKAPAAAEAEAAAAQLQQQQHEHGELPAAEQPAQKRQKQLEQQQQQQEAAEHGDGAEAAAAAAVPQPVAAGAAQ
ncbi:hypothetical protein ABPG75_010522 [Micractinium tetrahymenae]